MMKKKNQFITKCIGPDNSIGVLCVCGGGGV